MAAPQEDDKRRAAEEDAEEALMSATTSAHANPLPCLQTSRSLCFSDPSSSSTFTSSRPLHRLLRTPSCHFTHQPPSNSFHGRTTGLMLPALSHDGPQEGIRLAGEYRKQLDADREKKLARGWNHKDLRDKLKSSKKSDPPSPTPPVSSSLLFLPSRPGSFQPPSPSF